MRKRTRMDMDGGRKGEKYEGVDGEGERRLVLVRLRWSWSSGWGTTTLGIVRKRKGGDSEGGRKLGMVTERGI